MNIATVISFKVFDQLKISPVDVISERKQPACTQRKLYGINPGLKNKHVTQHYKCCTKYTGFQLNNNELTSNIKTQQINNLHNYLYKY